MTESYFSSSGMCPEPGVRREMNWSTRHHADLVAFAVASDPIATGIHLTPVLHHDGLFAPFRVRLPNEEKPAPLLTNQTPTGAFSYDGRVYVFVVCELPDRTWASYLTSSSEPARSTVYDVEFELLRGASAKFLQAAPAWCGTSKSRGCQRRRATASS